MLRFILSLAPLLAGLPLARADPPIYCVPASAVDADDAYVYIDESATCAETGHCAQACVTFIESYPCSTDGYDLSQITWLQQGVRDQLAQDGLFATSTEDTWTFSFIGLTTAFPNRDVSQEFETALSNFLNDGYTLLPRKIYFTMYDASGKNYLMLAETTC